MYKQTRSPQDFPSVSSIQYLPTLWHLTWSIPNLGDIQQHPTLSNPSDLCRCQFEVGYSTTVTVSVTVSSHQTGREQLFLSSFFAASHFQGGRWDKCHSPLLLWWWWAALTWVVAPTKLARRALWSRLGGAQEQPTPAALCSTHAGWRASASWKAVSLCTYSGTIAEASMSGRSLQWCQSQVPGSLMKHDSCVFMKCKCLIFDTVECLCQVYLKRRRMSTQRWQRILLNNGVNVRNKNGQSW